MSIFTKSLVAGAMALAVTGQAVQAADLSGPVEVVAAVQAQSPWMIRVRAIGVIPADRNDNVFVGGVSAFPGNTVNVSNTVVPELDITYFFTPNIAAELILATTRHNATATGTLGTTLAGLGQNTRLGTTWVLPPTLTLQYHFTNFGAFRPYVGAGVNYTFMYNEGDGALRNFRMSDNWGFALQAGFDYMFDQHWGINFDVKRLFLRSTASGNLLTPTGAPVSTRVNLDPWIIGTGITYRF